jgi:hypothetical protein
MKPYQQILYVPNHADGDTSHPDCERGFITYVYQTEDTALCAFWRQDVITPQNVNDLRTRANAEAVSMSNLSAYICTSDFVISDVVASLRSEGGK